MADLSLYLLLLSQTAQCYLTPSPTKTTPPPEYIDMQENEVLPRSIAVSASNPTIITPTPANNASPGHSPSYGFIAGIACGVVAAVVLLAAAFWYFRARKRLSGEEQGDKDRTMEHRDGADGASNGHAADEKNEHAAAPIALGGSATNHPSIDDLGPPASDLKNHTYDDKQHTVTSADLDPTSPTDSSIRDFATDYAPAVKASSSVSPSMSNHTSPSWTNSSSQLRSPTTARPPYTPSQYHVGAPDSIAKPFLEPPSLPQDYSAATFLSDTTRTPAGSYTPSNYQPGAPDSVARAAPSTLPQEYSTATLAPGDPPGSPIYRGLRTSSSSAFPPYAYLSPEDALAGGWTNDSPPRVTEH